MDLFFKHIGEYQGLNVNVKYIIKDSDGKIYLTSEELLFIEDSTSFLKDLDVSALSPGSYLIEVQVIPIESPGLFNSYLLEFEVVRSFVGIDVGSVLFYILTLTLFFGVIFLTRLIYLKISKNNYS